MNIDSAHKPWMIAFAVLAAAAAVTYGLLPARLEAGSVPGLCFACAGTALVAVCGLLPLRRKLLRVKPCARWHWLRWPLWDRGHIYAGLLGWLLLEFHCGFRLGGALTSNLAILLLIIVFSGVTNLLFRHLLPLTKSAREGKGLRAAQIIAAGHRGSLKLHVPLTATLFVLLVYHVATVLFY